MKVPISNKLLNAKFAILFLQAFLINTKILSLSRNLENYASYKKKKKKSHESKHFFSTFYISLPNFKALGSIIKKIS